MPRTRGSYPPAFRRRMIELVRAGANAGIAGPGIRAVGPGDSELGAPGGSRRGPAR